MESEFGYNYDVCWEHTSKEDVIMVDAGDEAILLSKSDLQTMLEMLS